MSDAQQFGVSIVVAGMRTAAASLLLVLFAACQSSDYDEPPMRTREMPRMRAASSGVLEMVPPADWWRDPQLANAVNLSTDQVASLEKFSKEQGDEADKLEHDSGVAVRDLKTLLDSDKPAQADIVAAGKRLREMRDDAFDRQLQRLAAERTILTKAQWQALQDALASRQNERRGGRDRGGYGGRGGFPGRGGRRPGWPG